MGSKEVSHTLAVCLSRDARKKIEAWLQFNLSNLSRRKVSVSEVLRAIAGIANAGPSRDLKPIPEEIRKLASVGGTLQFYTGVSSWMRVEWNRRSSGSLTLVTTLEVPSGTQY